MVLNLAGPSGQLYTAEFVCKLAVNMTREQHSPGAKKITNTGCYQILYHDTINSVFFFFFLCV